MPKAVCMLIKNKTILAVDDEPAVLEALVYLLQTEGYDVMSAHDAKLALTLMDFVRPDLVVTDFMMPAMSRLDLATEMRWFCRGKAVRTCNIDIMRITYITNE